MKKEKKQNFVLSSSRRVSVRDIMSFLFRPILRTKTLRNDEAGRSGTTRCRVTPCAVRGFTLIELLVVVLIIGILAAIALPKYQKAVAKTQATQALTLLKSLEQAYKAYYMANGQWATSLDDLDIRIPWTGHTPWRDDLTSTHSNADWSVQLQLIPLTEQEMIPVIYIGRLTGPYAGTGFAYFFNDWGSDPTWGAPADTLNCLENRPGVDGVIFTKEPGDFCKKIMGAPKPTQSGMHTSYFIMP